MPETNNATNTAASAETPGTNITIITPNTDASAAKPESAGPPKDAAKPEESPKHGRPASPWNSTQLDELAIGERFCLAAMQEQYKPVFLKYEFTPERLTAIHQKILQARNQTALTGQSGTATEENTIEQADAQRLLLADIRKVQAAAKQKHARTNPTVLKDFLVGTDVDQNRPALQQHSQSVLKKLETERPPGIDTEFITDMTGHRKALVGGGVAQGSTESSEEKERFKRNEQIEAIKDERIAIQYVIDAEFGPGDPANAAVRREFGLHPNRPFNAIKRKSA